ncbi:hypothetical protein AGDE_00990 [Angomonas deanei]|uniref:Lipid-droplet associated hydrolase, putative n=1 Tax=Angomonas deanei TaxID=59799 RepID=S9WMI2_9TRYP|nr:hypothetical protein AGDE_09921 [Angomonas deanei]EPY38904.1 hypothetical protein AGDE_05025 [Angomonas deanei]EPY40406.1 hypothetical protein AGDE_03522 [Angomonas deanei]EPY42933.1 hypothetical protein AGDE_00990 [Angomonas deanei]CAD2215903.1 Lipid-droplet associated hydrolase, putative [Angomonas deanei]|eukprot:EPY29690.1 hypothetical protein AGDE_09921 [Angomonas deanei]
MFFWGVMVLQWIAAYCGSLFALLPIPLKRYVVNAKGADVNPEIRKLLAEKVHKNLLMNVFFMSMTEYRLLLRPDKPLLSCNQEKLVMYYVKKDGWCPLKHASEIKEACPRVHAYIVDEDSSIPHAWCLQHTKHVVDHAVLKYI